MKEIRGDALARSARTSARAPKSELYLVRRKKRSTVPTRKNEKINTTTAATGLQLKPKRDFLRLDKPFNDAVRSKKTSAVSEVLLRVPIAGDNARRTAKKILADR